MNPVPNLTPPRSHSFRAGALAARLVALLALYRAPRKSTALWLLTALGLGILTRVTEDELSLLALGTNLLPLVIISLESQAPDKDYERLLPVNRAELFALRYLSLLLPLLTATGVVLLIRNTGLVARLWSLVATGPLATPAPPFTRHESVAILLGVVTLCSTSAAFSFGCRLGVPRVIGTLLLTAAAGGGIAMICNEPVARQVIGGLVALTFNGILLTVAWARLAEPIEETKKASEVVVANPAHTRPDVISDGDPVALNSRSPRDAGSPRAHLRALFEYTFGPTKTWWALGIVLYLVLPVFIPWAGFFVPGIGILSWCVWLYLHKDTDKRAREEFALILPVSREHVFWIRVGPLVLGSLFLGGWSALVSGVWNIPGHLFNAAPIPETGLVLMAFGPTALAGVYALEMGYPRFAVLIINFIYWIVFIIAVDLMPEQVAVILLGIAAGGVTLGRHGFLKKEIVRPTLRPGFGNFGC